MSPERIHAEDCRPPELVIVGSPGGGRRILTLLDRGDEAVYRTLVERVADVVERALPRAVLGNRVAGGPGIALLPWRPAWRRLLAERRALSARGSVLLHADVRKCYASIAGVAVDRALERLGADRDDRRAIGRQLGRFQDQGVPGLPIGPDPSAVLANAVLMDADLAFDEAGCPHLRWVDDVWAAAPNRDRAERALDLLRSALERIGLAVNEDKTCVVDAGAAGSILGGASGPRL